MVHLRIAQAVQEVALLAGQSQRQERPRFLPVPWLNNKKPPKAILPKEQVIG